MDSGMGMGDIMIISLCGALLIFLMCLIIYLLCLCRSTRRYIAADDSPVSVKYYVSIQSSTDEDSESDTGTVVFNVPQEQIFNRTGMNRFFERRVCEISDEERHFYQLPVTRKREALPSWIRETRRDKTHSFTEGKSWKKSTPCPPTQRITFERPNSLRLLSEVGGNYACERVRMMMASISSIADIDTQNKEAMELAVRNGTNSTSVKLMDERELLI